MKSQMIKVHNLPISTSPTKSISVKPKGLLYLLMLIGIGICVKSSYFSAAGVCFIMVPVFALGFLPDRELLRFTQDYLVMFNNRNRTQCMIIYWDEIVSWQYEWHPSSDLLVVNLIDGSSQSVDMFSKQSVAKLMNLFAPNKEMRKQTI